MCLCVGSSVPPNRELKFKKSPQNTCSVLHCAWHKLKGKVFPFDSTEIEYSKNKGVIIEIFLYILKWLNNRCWLVSIFHSMQLGYKMTLTLSEYTLQFILKSYKCGGRKHPRPVDLINIEEFKQSGVAGDWNQILSFFLLSLGQFDPSKSHQCISNPMIIFTKSYMMIFTYFQADTVNIFLSRHSEWASQSYSHPFQLKN